MDQQGYSKTPIFTELKTYMSGKGYKNSSTSMMLWTKVIYYNGDHFAKVIAWDAAGIPSRIMSKWGTAELIVSSSTNPFISIYGTGTYYFN